MKSARALKGLLLFHGAGSDRDHSSLLQIEHDLAPLPVRRANFAYRSAGKRPPDRAPVLLETVRDEAVAFATERHSSTRALVLGGRSMGGRICSMAVAGGDDIGVAMPAAGLVLIAYPLHPPGQPDKLRVEHHARLSVPCLFIHGTRDPFGSPDELRRWTATIPAKVDHVWLPGKTHDLKGCDADIAAAVSGWMLDLRVALARG